MAHRTCSIPGCGKPHLARGWCPMHYSRWHSNGDPLVQRRSLPRERLWDLVVRGPGCWEWPRTRDGGGYGWIAAGGKTYKTHRLAWELTNGPIPPDMWVLHHCDNPPCIRPDLLFLGTPSDNVQDMLRKGRDRHPDSIPATQGANHYSRRHPEKVLRGSLNGAAKLTTEQVRQVRALAAAGMTHKAIAARYGISNQGVSRVVRRKVYADVA